MIQVTSNTAEVKRNLVTVQKRFTFASKKSAEKGGHYIRDKIREQVPPGGGQSAGNFDGYAAKGNLRKYIVTSAPQQRGKGDWVVRVYVRGYEGTNKYARIHNVGGIIRAKNGGWLVFPKPPEGATRSAKIPGNQAFEKDGKIFARAVRIRRKLYFFHGYEEAKKDLPTVVKSEFFREVRAWL